MTGHDLPIELRLPVIAAAIQRRIPGSEIRLFGSRARGTANLDSDIDLLITAPDEWMRHHHRFLTRLHHRKRILLHTNRSHADHECSRLTAERQDTARNAPPVKGQDLS